MFYKIMDFWMILLGIKQPVRQPVTATEVHVEEVPMETSVVFTEEEVEVVDATQSSVDLKSMTKKQLADFAAERNIEIDARKKKDIMIETIEVALG